METLNEKYKQDFNMALNIYENDYSHDELITFLKEGSVAEKQAAAIKLDKLLSKYDVEIFMQNLTGCDGKIREAVSFRLPEFIKNSPEFFANYVDIFLEAIIDINGNICRNTICALEYLKTNKEFCDEFCEKLIQKAFDLTEKVKDFNIQDGKYKINKEVFKLYWYLETICVFCENFENSKIFDLLNITKDITDYTIREKTAKILSKIKEAETADIKAQLAKDDNYYVRRYK